MTFSSRYPSGPLWIQEIANPAERTKQLADWVDHEALKWSATRIYRDALSRGELVRAKTCSACGRECTPDGHHADYAKPLEVVWLCRSCHIREHKHARLRFEAAHA